MFKPQTLKLLKTICLIGITVSVFLCAAGCKKDDGGDTPNEDEFSPSSGLNISEDAAKELNNKVRIITYFVNEDCTKLEGEVRHMEMDEAKQSTENIATKIVEELLKGPSESFAGKRIIPEGTKILAPVSITGTLAVVNLSSEFINNNSGERKNIEMSIYSLVNSITEIKELDRVKILIDGKEEATFKGVVEMNMPFKRNKSLISVSLVSAKDASAEMADEDDDDMLLE